MRRPRSGLKLLPESEVGAPRNDGTWSERMQLVEERRVTADRVGPSPQLDVRLKESMLVWASVGDPDTHAHGARVAEHTTRLAVLAGLDADEAALIGRASRLHDLGKIGVPRRLLELPRRLTPAERRELERHALIGHHLLAGTGIPLLELAATIALTHHERFDGTGYPRGLRGTETPIEGRITAIADAFDAMTSPRVYRVAVDEKTAIDLLQLEAGAQFDPRLLELFITDLRASRAEL
jgi:putative two-component system response regulator